MKDYFRREKLSFKYNPIHWFGRLLFIFLIVTSGILQWIVVLFGSAFSISFVHSTEMEHMLPMSDDELIRKKLTKVGMAQISCTRNHRTNIYLFCIKERMVWFLYQARNTQHAPGNRILCPAYGLCLRSNA